MTHRTVLDDNLGGGGNSLPTLMGNIMHDLFQSTISCHALPTPDAMDAMAEAAVAQHAPEIFEVATQRRSAELPLDAAVKSVEAELLEKVKAAVPSIRCASPPTRRVDSVFR
jgi:hypothetical protein